MEKKNIVITIARQYGSGGKTIGAMLAEELHIPYYDKDLMKLASEDSGINEALFAKADEKVKTICYTRLQKSLSGRAYQPGKRRFYLQRQSVQLSGKNHPRTGG